MTGYKTFTFNPFQEKTVVVWRDGSSSCAIVDPGCCTPEEFAELEDFISWKSLRPEKILLTHGHWDHIYGVSRLSRDYGGLEVLMHPADKDTVALAKTFTQAFGMRAPDTGFTSSPVKEGDIVRIGENLEFEVIETPGHTPGGVCYYCREGALLLSGDTLFCGTIGRTDLPGGDYDTLIGSILGKLMVLPGDVDVVTGHGPDTNIAEEGARNPFLSPFNEPETNWDDIDAIGLG